SSNDTFPTAMHVATALETQASLLPALDRLRGALRERQESFADIVKIGRTHTQDATPLTLGQEFSGYVAALSLGRRRIEEGFTHVCALAQGGTAVGTGLNAPRDFSRLFAERISERTGLPFRPADNLFEALAGHGALAGYPGALAALAGGLLKIANDSRFRASGPATGRAH